MKNVFVALDVKNILAVCKGLFGNSFRFDYRKLLKVIASDCEEGSKIDAIAYFTTSKKFSPGDAGFSTILSNLGYKIEKQNSLPRTRPGLYIMAETDWCSGIATDAISGMFEKNYDVFIIITGDNDFRYLTRFIMGKKKRSGVYTFNNPSFFDGHASFVRQLDKKYVFSVSRRYRCDDEETENVSTDYEDSGIREA